MFFIRSAVTLFSIIPDKRFFWGLELPRQHHVGRKEPLSLLLILRVRDLNKPQTQTLRAQMMPQIARLVGKKSDITFLRDWISWLWHGASGTKIL